METPLEIVPHQSKYQPDAWKDYTPAELGWWVHLLVKRSGHRSERSKAIKDAADAASYLAMLAEHVKAASAKAGSLPE